MFVFAQMFPRACTMVTRPITNIHTNIINMKVTLFVTLSPLKGCIGFNKIWRRGTLIPEKENILFLPQ